MAMKYRAKAHPTRNPVDPLRFEPGLPSHKPNSLLLGHTGPSVDRTLHCSSPESTFTCYLEFTLFRIICK